MERYTYKFTNELNNYEWETTLREKLNFETIQILAAGFTGAKQGNFSMHF